MKNIILIMLTACTLAISITHADEIDSYTFGAIKARSIGPAVMSGRITCIDAVNSNPLIIYAGAANGGIWKSTTGGNQFQPVFDDHILSIGCLAIDQAHPDTVWAGTGETWVRNSVSVGAGIFKTANGGKSWKCLGLEKTERIADIIIHPDNSDIIYVAAMGHLWDANSERGVYKTTDGGKTWEKILYIDENTGCTDLAIDPQEPDILYAAFWQFRRYPYSFNSGGPGSGLYKSLDSGKTWTELTNNLPACNLGRIAIAAAPTRPGRLYASIEAEKDSSGLFSSDDYGHTWKKMTSSKTVLYRPFYFSFLAVDPLDYNTIYKTAFNLMISDNSGKSFRQAAAGMHPDIHALWINPSDPSHLLTGTDGGIYTSRDQGHSWRHLRSLPLSQFYRVSCDMQKPYNVYGGLQDNGSWFGPSRSPGGIENKDWQNVGGGDGFCVFAHPENTNIIYSEWQQGNLRRFNLAYNESKDIKPAPKTGEPEYRFNWNAPVSLSPHNPDGLYIGSQFLLYSPDRGESWLRLSDDLTTDDPEKQKQAESGGLTIDNSGAENHCTIFTIAESPLNEDILWVGTDDGNLQVSRNRGKSWSNVTANLPGLPACTWCSHVEADRFKPGTAWAAFDGHRSGDCNTYLFKTMDYGQTWVSLSNATIEGYAHVIKQDPVKNDLLYAGTEFGLFISIDGGGHWARFTGNLPRVPVMDIVIHPRESDIILATHGRGIFIIDDISPLRSITSEVLDADLAFLKSKPAIIKTLTGRQGWPGGDEFVGANPEEVLNITYFLKRRHIFGTMKIEIYDDKGKLIKTLPGGKRRGINRINWALRLKPPKIPKSSILSTGSMLGPDVPEGLYSVKLVKGKKTYTTKIQILTDPDSPHSKEDRLVRDKAVWKLFDMQGGLTRVSEAINDAKSAADKIAADLPLKNKTRIMLEKFTDKLQEFKKTFVVTESSGISGKKKLRDKVVGLYGSVVSYSGRPTQTQLLRMDIFEKEIIKVDKQFTKLIKSILPGINKRLKKSKLPPIKIPSRNKLSSEGSNP